MIIETKEIYKCSHCRKLYQKKEACRVHEYFCHKNPDFFRACHTCITLKKVEASVFEGTDYDGEEYHRDVMVLYCSSVDKYIYPPKVGFKGNMFSFIGKNNVEMPQSCPYQKTFTAST